MNCKPYPKYKESIAEWLGQIPEKWGVIPLRYAFLNLDFRRIPLAGVDRADLEKKYPYYGASGVIDYVEDYIFDETLILVAEDGANLLSRSTPLAFLATGKYWVNNHAHILKPISGDIGYWVGVLQTFDYTPLITGAAQPKLTADRLGSILLPKPPGTEQTAIADFLDRETGRIDTLVAKKRRLIALLGEKRTALISRTVTRGLPADAAREFGLEPHTRFKDSGIEWLGEVPEGWEVCALKRITISRCDGPFGSGLKSEHYCDDGVRVIRLQNIRLGQFDNRDSAFINPEHYTELGDHTVIPGDVLIAGLGDENNPVGRACVAPCGIGPAMVKADCFRFRLKLTHARPTYIALQLSMSANSLGGALATGTTRGRMNLSTTENREIVLPSLPEQTAIATYLDRETATIDQLVAKVEAAIVRLLEYRTALITAAVTGKIDVRPRETP